MGKLILALKGIILISVMILAGLLTTAAIKIIHPAPITKAESKVKGKFSPVVRLITNDGRTFCTGVVVSPNTVITAAHCIIEAVILGIPIFRSSFVTDSTFTVAPVATNITSASSQLDQATLHGNFSAFESRNVITDVATLNSKVEPGSSFVSCGYPLGGALFCSRQVYQGRINFMWLMKGVLLPGMSGGPMMLDDGTVIAINDAVQDDFSIVSPTFNTPVQ